MSSSSLLYRVSLFAIYLIPFTPLIVTERLFFPFIVGKALFFRILVETAFFAWLPVAIRDRRYRPRASAMLFTFTSFTFWMLAANVLAPNPAKALWGNFERMDGWLTLAHLFLFFVVIGAVSAGAELRNIKHQRSHRPLMMFWSISLVVSVAVSLMAIHDVVAVQGFSAGARAVGPLGNSIYLAAYNLFHIFFPAFFFLNLRAGQLVSHPTEPGSPSGSMTRGLSYGCVAVAVINTISLVASGTRGAVLGLVVGGLAAVFVYAVSKAGRRFWSARTALVLGACALALAAVVLLSRMPALRRAPILSRMTDITFSAGETRFMLWRMALEGARARPIFGWGQEGYNYVFNAYYRPSLFSQEPWYDRAHNEYLDWLAAGGVPAFLLFLSLFYFAWRAVWRHEPWQTRAPLVGLLVAYALHSVFVFNVIPASIFFVSILAYAHTLSLGSGREASVGDEVHRPIHPYARKYASVITLTILACAGFTIRSVNGRAYDANFYLLSALNSPDPRVAMSYFTRALDEGMAGQEISEQMVLFASRMQAGDTPAELKARAAQAALAAIAQQVREAPQDARAYVFRAIAHQAAGDLPGARSDYAKAQELSPHRQRFLMDQGLIAFLSGDGVQAAAFFHRAHALEESFAEPAAYAAAGLMITGRPEEGRALLQKYFGNEVPAYPLVQKVFAEFAVR